MDELQSQGLPIEMRQDFAARGAPLCADCQNLQRQLRCAEIDAAYWQNQAKAALDEDHTDQSDSSVRSGGQEFNSEFYHGALLRAEINHPDALMRPGGITHPYLEQQDWEFWVQVPHHMWTFW